MTARPTHLYRAGRPVVTTFESTTKLYTRYPCDRLLDGDPIDPLALHFPNLSVCRNGLDVENGPDDARWSTALEAFSRPPEYESGSCVIGFTVADVPLSNSPLGSDRIFYFRIEHVPYEDLYPHCEIRAYLGAATDPILTESKIPGTVRKAVKQKIADAVSRHGQFWKAGSP